MGSDPIEVVRTVEELWNASKLDDLDLYFAADFHAYSHVQGLEPTLASAKMVHQMAMAGFGEKHSEIVDIFASGEKVCARIRMTGSNSGTGAWWLNAPNPDGKKFEFEYMSIYQVKDGKIIAHWGIADMFTGMVQLGGAQAPMPPA